MYALYKGFWYSLHLAAPGVYVEDDFGNLWPVTSWPYGVYYD